MKATRTLQLTRSIILDGEHAEEGTEHEVARALASRLVGEGSAVYTDDEEAPASVNRMESPTNADPKSKQISGPKAKVKEAEK